MEESQEPRGPPQDSGEQPPPPASALWADLQALLPGSPDSWRLDFGEAVEGSVVLLLQQAAGLLYSARSDDGLGLCLSEAVVDYSWEKLNVGPWRDVSKEWRRVYAYGCLFKALALCRSRGAGPEEALRACDLGLLMGASILGNLLARVVSVLQRHVPRPKRPAAGDAKEPPRQKKTRLGPERPEAPAIKTEERILQLACPSLEHFRDHFLLPQKPVVLKGIVDHWPCMKKWSVDYFRQVAGSRTVPVEVGSRYTDEEWSQVLMTVNDFIGRYIENENQTGYLAQHQLFDQIPELKQDIGIPDYCCLGEGPGSEVPAPLFPHPVGEAVPPQGPPAPQHQPGGRGRAQLGEVPPVRDGCVPGLRPPPGPDSLYPGPVLALRPGPGHQLLRQLLVVLAPGLESRTPVGWGCWSPPERRVRPRSTAWAFGSEPLLCRGSRQLALSALGKLLRKGKGALCQAEPRARDFCGEGEAQCGQAN